MTDNELWSVFCEKSGTDENTPHTSWCFGGNADILVSLVMLGYKTATASAYDLYALDDSAPLPKAGDLSIVLDSKGNALCIIKTKKVYTVPYCEVSADHAAKEGEGDLTLSYWRRAHSVFFMEQYKEYGLKFNENIPVLCEEFELIFSLYTVSDTTEDEGKQICDWKYDGEYAVYNFSSWEDCIRLGWDIALESKRKNAYFSVYYMDELFGFFHIIRRNDKTLLGVGANPEFCGKGMGHQFVSLGAAKILHDVPSLPLELTVRPFNKRAIKCYESVGFRLTNKYFASTMLAPGEMYDMRYMG